MTTAPETAGAVRVCEREIPAVLSTAHAVAEAARRETLRHFRSNTLVTDEQGRTRRCPVLRPRDHRRPRRRGRDARGSGRAQTAGRDPGRGGGRRAGRKRPDLGARPDRRDARLHRGHAHMGRADRALRCRRADLRHHRPALYRRTVRGRAGARAPDGAPWRAPAVRGPPPRWRGDAFHHLPEVGTEADRAASRRCATR
jgi:hypothetical protein